MQWLTCIFRFRRFLAKFVLEAALWRVQWDNCAAAEPTLSSKWFKNLSANVVLIQPEICRRLHVC